MTLQELLQRKPSGLGPEHERLAKSLLGRPEGISRDEAPRVLDLEERVFRRLVEECVASGWLPIAPDPTTNRYRLLGPTEHDVVNAYSRREKAKAISTIERVRGLTMAFQNTHGAGGLFLDPAPSLEDVA